MKVCPNCGKEHNNSRSDYCGEKLIRKCPICLENFEAICNAKLKKLCSAKCVSKNGSNKAAEKQNNKQEITSKCDMCGKQFIHKIDKFDNKKYKTCSHQCRFQLESNPITCEYCGKEFLPKSKNVKVCSPQCSGKLSQTKEVKEKRVNTNMEKYGAKNPFESKEIKQKIKETNIERYGTEFPTQTAEVRQKTEQTNLDRYGVKVPLQNKDIMDKLKKTNLDRYGFECSMNNKEVKEKSKQTMIERYGVSEPFLSKEIQDKVKQTNLKRYGVENPFANEDIKQRIKEVNLDRYGAENYSNRISLEEELKERDEYVIELYNDGITEYEIAELLNYEYITIRRVLLKNNIVKPNNISQINKYWSHKLQKELGVKFEHEGKIFTDKRMSVDLYNDDFKIAIDINPTITHSTQETPFINRKTTPINYHRDRAENAINNGWQLIQIFDWDIEEDIFELLRSKLGMNDKLFARKCIVKEISHTVSKNFLNKNHRQEGLANSSIQYGLFYENELIQVMTFSKERFSRDRQEDSYELLRLTSKRGITVVGGASKLFKAFTRSNYKPKEVKTFADFSKGSGSSYLKLGMTDEGFANINALYASIYTNEAYKVTQVTNKYMKEYSKLGLTQKQFMNEKGFYRITDAGNKVFRWININNMI